MFKLFLDWELERVWYNLDICQGHNILAHLWQNYEFICVFGGSVEDTDLCEFASHRTIIHGLRNYSLFD
jgi:hypothetical protein